MVDDDYFGPMRAHSGSASDYLGRDMLSRGSAWARATPSAYRSPPRSIACFIGVVLGMIAAVTGGWLDSCLSRFLDAMNSIPSKLFGLVVVAAVGSSIPVLILTLAVIYIPGAYRFARALAVNINTHGLHHRRARPRRKHRLPHRDPRSCPTSSRPVLADFGLRFVFIVLLLSGLSFLGLGVQPPHADWGALVRENIGGLPFGAPAVIMPVARDRQPDHQRQPADRQPAAEDQGPGAHDGQSRRDQEPEGRARRRTPAGDVEIIKGVSFDIADGEIVALIGESGSGKTTIALTLHGLCPARLRISGGSVSVNGTGHGGAYRKGARRAARRRHRLRPAKRRRRLQPRAHDHGAGDRGRAAFTADAARKRASARAVELFRALALPDPEGIGARYPHQVSGGQLQRLSAAMALIGDPKLVIFDEPTTALDVTTQIEVLRAFKSVMRERGTRRVYVSHDLAVVAQIADRIVVLNGGEVQEIGTTAQVLIAPQHPYTRETAGRLRTEAARKRRADADARATPLLEIRDVTAGYGRVGPTGCRCPCVHDVDRQPGRRERRKLGVIGESGCGKIDAGARHRRHPAGGRAATSLFDGKQLPRSCAGTQPGPAARDADRVPDMPIPRSIRPSRSSDIIARPLAFYHGLDAAGAPKRVDELLDMVRLPAPLRYRHPAELSGGQKQRVNFARALAADPKLDYLRRNHLGARHGGGAADDRAAQGAAARTGTLLHVHQPRPLRRRGDLRRDHGHVQRASGWSRSRPTS